tara:strand:+ start:32663 stop:33037 length:375 start_codon:yes stop_codon:yes gene_type:complete
MILSQFVDVLFLSFCCASVLFIWLETNAFYEYVRYFNLGGTWSYKYEEYKKQNKFSQINLPAYLALSHDCFSVRLITCSICLSFWLNLFLNLFIFEIVYFPFTFVLSLSVYYLLTIMKNKLENA